MSDCCQSKKKVLSIEDLSQSGDASPKKGGSLPQAWREAAVFGALWGAVEITIGSFLYATRLPLKGVFLSSLAAAVLVASHMLIRRPWFPLRAALICVALRTLAPDGIRGGLMFALLFQGFEVSLFFILLRSPLLAGIAAGITAAVASQIQSFVVRLFTYGADFWDLFLSLLNKAERLFHLDSGNGWAIVSGYLILVGLVGATGGLLGWKVGKTAVEIRKEQHAAPR